MKKSEKAYVHLRAEIAARLFLEELGAEVWTTVEDGSKGPFHAIASFVTNGQKPRIAAIEVKATEQPVGEEFHFLGRPAKGKQTVRCTLPVVPAEQRKDDC